MYRYALIIVFIFSFPANAVETIKIKDMGQSEFILNEKTIEIPKIRPFKVYDSGNNYLYAQLYDDGKSYEVRFTIGPCEGQFTCYQGSYARYYLSSELDKRFLYSLLAPNKEIKFGKRYGHIIPMQLNAYPTPTYLVWEDSDFLHVIGTKGPNEEYLLNSAKSLY